MKSGRNTISPFSGRGILVILMALLTTAFIQGCAAPDMKNAVVVGTGTTVGVGISQNHATKAPSGILGYKRAEFAHIPTNRGADKTTEVKENSHQTRTKQKKDAPTPSGGAKDSANVLMEFFYRGIFNWSNGSDIYQRLAVGDTAVSQISTSVMFAKEPTGMITEKTILALQAARRIPPGVDISTLDWLNTINRVKMRRARIKRIVNYLKGVTDETKVDVGKLQNMVNSLPSTDIDAKDFLSLGALDVDDVREFLDGAGYHLVDDLYTAGQKIPQF